MMFGQLRNENLRITVGPFANFAIIYCFGNLYLEKSGRNNFILDFIIFFAIG